MPEDKKKDKANISCKKCIIDRVVLWVMAIVVTIIAVELFHVRADMAELNGLPTTIDDLSDTVNAIIQYISAIQKTGGSGRLSGDMVL